MTTDVQEQSTALGQPVELYRFSYDLTRLCYSDTDVTVGHDGDNYDPGEALSRDPINASGSLDKAAIEVSIAESSDVAKLWAGYPPSDVVGLTIFRCHLREDGTNTIPMAIWVGRVIACSYERYIAKLSCEPAATSMQRVGLRRHYQYMCPHALYGTACGANRASHTVGRTAVAWDMRSVTVSSHLGDQYRGGIVSWQPAAYPMEQRTILGVHRLESGETRLDVAGRPHHLRPGDPVSVARGCLHTIDECRGVFDNAPNFGGMPYIPTNNPHGTTRIFN